jgi:hypothetical protein
VIVEPSHAVIAGVRRFRLHIEADARRRSGSMRFRRRMIALSPIRPNSLGIPQKTLATVFVLSYLPWKTVP